MDLALDESQELLKNTATEFMETELPRQRVREIDDSDIGYAPDIWQKMCELGWGGIALPEQYGGADRPFTDLAVLHEVLGYYACTSPHLDSTVLSAQIILTSGSEAQKNTLLPLIASGQQIFVTALTEPEYGWGPSAIQMRADQQGDKYVLNGDKVFIPWAQAADTLLVAARTSTNTTPEKGISLFLVDKNTAGITTRVHSGWLADKPCEINFENVEISASDLVGSAGEAWDSLESSLDRATAILCASMSGGARKAYEMARDYSTERIAFGVPIGTFQWVQSHVIDALTEADSLQWTMYEALWQLDNEHAGASQAISSAKAIASTGFAKACDASHDVHAGVGVDLDFGLTHYTKRSRTYQQYLGDAIYHKKRIAELMKLSGETV
jgi:alkylation response protein AidB-like acyl-CoA dehydrogenase